MARDNESLRIIRTDIMYPIGAVHKTSNRSASLNPGVTFVFLGADRNIRRHIGDSEFDIGQIVFSQNIHLDTRPKKRSYYEFVISIALDTALKGAPLSSLSRSSYEGTNRLELIDEENYKFSNQSLINELFETNIVVEHSPPEWLAVKDLLRFGPVVGGGMAIGVYTTSQPIVLITVPFGIVLMGSAVAIAKSFEKGLPRVIDERILRRIKR